MVKNAKKRSARVDSRADISVTNGPIDKRQTGMCREMHGLAYAMSLGERHVARAVLMAPSVKICGFWTFFTIPVGAQKLIDFRRCHNTVLQKNVPTSRYIKNAGFLLAITCFKSIGKHYIG